MTRYSVIDWIPVTSVLKQNTVFEILYTEVETLLGKEEMLSVKEIITRPFERNDRVH